MKKIILFAVCFLVFFVSTKAQQWQWAYNEGGSSGTDIEVDPYGNIFVLASISSSVYGTYTLPCGTAGPVIAKHDAGGNVIWARGMGINADGTSFSMDKIGNIYITGSLQLSTTFCGGNNPNIAIIIQGGQQSDAFLCKYNNSGDLQWVQTWGTTNSNDGGNAVKTDLSGNSYVTGRYLKGPYQGGPLCNFFVRKYDSQGNLLWDRNSNWKGDMYATGIDLDMNENSYITGYFGDSAYFGAISFKSNAQNHTIFIAKYNKNGDVIWAKKDGTNYDECHGICFDKKGSFYITGLHSNPSAFGNNTLSTGSMFIAKYDTSGTALWAKSSGARFGYGVSVDSAGACFVTGSFSSISIFGAGLNSINLSTLKNGDLFVAKYDKNGNFNWVVAPGGNGGYSNIGNAINCDSQNNCYITGFFTSTTTFGNYLLNAVGPYSIFVAKLKDTSAILTDVKHTLTSQNGLIIFPNPTLNSININYKSTNKINDLKVTIRNVTGQEIYTSAYKNSGTEFNNEIYVEKYARGVYLIEIVADGQRLVRMIILN